ncbi:MAG: 50S ribosomal protein L4, partial [Pseudomonadota bacterium]|nr:50S ribosomal protein L4 [Pseudomonadota bacterium]
GMICALSMKQSEGKLVVIDGCAGGSGKTKELAAQLKALGWKSALVVDQTVDDSFLRAAQNVIGIDVLPTIGANVYDIVRHDLLVVTAAGLEGLKARLAPAQAETVA